MQHSLEEQIGNEEPFVIFLTDQSFPPILPADDGKCTTFLREEDMTLFELEKLSRSLTPLFPWGGGVNDEATIRALCDLDS